ncbi:MAG: TIR domain-containing protein [bacterium]|nr:TIR domain-containing protein [bacterium]
MHSSPKRYDVFLSYHWLDRAIVDSLARALRKCGIEPFLDRWYLVPGKAWPGALEQALTNCRAVAVLVGPHGFGSWQQRERSLALDRQTADPSFPVVPVLLPGSEEPGLGFLGLNTWVDLRQVGIDEQQLDVLVAATRGEAIGPEIGEALASARATICPYRGLRPFREEDAEFFCGREEYTERLVEIVLATPLVGVIGASGSGKSSVVRAGLFPALRRATGDTIWEIAKVVPGDQPLKALAAALVPVLEPEMSRVDRRAEINKLAEHLAAGRLTLAEVVTDLLEVQPGTTRLLLFVDQWEELYTLCSNDAERDRFVQAVLDATTACPVSVVLAMRGDFFGYALHDRRLADALQDHVVNLGPMTSEELERSIRRPADRVGLEFESGLVDRMMDDVGNEPGNLPLLEFVLTSLWERRRAGTMHHAAYEEIGGVEGAIANRADEVFAKLSVTEQAAARRVLIRMVRLGEGTEDTRRRIVAPTLDEETAAVLRELASARLVVTGRDDARGDDTAEVAHEALIRSWQLLRGWVEADREFLRARARIENAASQWEEDDHDEDRLLPVGRALVEAEELVATRRGDLGQRVVDFVDLSSQMAHRQQRRRARRARLLISVMTVLAVTASWFGVQAHYAEREASTNLTTANQATARAKANLIEAHLQKDRAEDERNNALRTQSRFLVDLARQRSNAGDSRQAILLALEALPRDLRSPERPELAAAWAALHEVLVAGVDAPSMLAEQLDRRAVLADWSPDGKRLYTCSQGKLEAWDRNGRSPEVVAEIEGQPEVSPDGRRILVWGIGGLRIVPTDGNGQAVELDTSTRRYSRVEWSADGTRILTVDESATRVWQVGVAAQPVVWPGINPAAWSPQGARLLVAPGDTTVRILEADGSEIEFPGGLSGVYHLSWSSNGKRVIVGRGGRARVWDVGGDSPPRMLRAVEGKIFRGLSPDGRRVCITSPPSLYATWTAKLVSLDESIPPVELGPVRDVAWSPDGSQVAVASSDSLTNGSIRNSDGTGEPIALSAWDVYGVQWSPDGRRVLAHSFERVQIFSADGRAGDVAPVATRGNKRGWRFSSDGARLVTTSTRHSAVWNTAGTGPTFPRFGGARRWAFSPDGSRLVTSGNLDGDKHAVRVWPLNSAADPIEVAGPRRELGDFEWSADGQHLLVRPKPASFSKPVPSPRTWILTGAGEPVRLPGNGETLQAAAFGPEGQRIAIAQAGAATAEIHALDGVGPPIALTGPSAPITSLAWRSGGDRLMATCEGGSVWIWDAQGRAMDREFQGRAFRIVAWSPDGRRLVTVTDNAGARIRSLDGVAAQDERRFAGEDLHLVAWSPDNCLIACVYAKEASLSWRHYADFEVVVRSADGSQRPVTWKHAGETLRSFAWSPDSTRILGVTVNKHNTVPTAWIWRANGEESPIAWRVPDMAGHNSNEIRAASWSPDSRRVLLHTSERFIRVVNSDGTGEPILLQGVRNSSSSSWTPDGKFIFVGSYDGGRSSGLFRVADELVTYAKGLGIRPLTSSERGQFFLDDR